MSENYFQSFDGTSLFERLMGVPLRVTVSEDMGKRIKKGGYIELQGKLWKVVRVVLPTLWTDETVVLYLKNWTNQGVFPSPGQIAWLEDSFLLSESA